MFFLVFLGCVIPGGPLKPVDTTAFDLDSLDAGVGGNSVAEYAAAELSFSLDVDWSETNAPGFAPETIDVTPGTIPSQGNCETDEAGDAFACDFDVAATVGSSSGLWNLSDTYSVHWNPGELSSDFLGDCALTADQAASVADGLTDGDLAFSGDSLELLITWGTGVDGSHPQRDQVTVKGIDDVSGSKALFAEDDSVGDN